MKAFVYTKYSTTAGALKYVDIDTPAISKEQVLIEVKATSVNRADVLCLQGKPRLLRLSTGLFRPKKSKQILGSDISGIVVKVGSKVTSLKEGDEVYGEIGHGGFAQYAVASPKTIAIKPFNLSYVQAAAMPLTAITALQAVRDKGKVSTVDHVLLNGSAGGVGHFALQLAKYYGAEVTAVCSTSSVAMVKSLGADNIIDYTKGEQATDNNYDVVIDTVGNLKPVDYGRFEVLGGRGVSVGFVSMSRILRTVIFGKKFNVSALSATPNTKDLDYLRSLTESGNVAPVIYKQYSFHNIPETVTEMMKGKTNGKIVIDIAGQS